MEQKEVKTAKKPVKRAKKKDKQPDIVDQINFHELFVAKGFPGLWVMRSAPIRTNFINMAKFMQFDVFKTMKTNNLTSLGHFVFQTELGKDDLHFRDVFRNIFNNEKKFFKLSVEDQMEMAVPCFDEDCFKDYHMQKVCLWYNEIIKGLDDEIRNQGKNIKKTVTD
jgi:hypothetical protein